MQFSASTIATAAALLSGVAMARPAPATDSGSSSTAFGLSVTSLTSSKYSNAAVGACHSGAAIEALCVSSFASPFTFNSSASAPPHFSGDTDGGYLQFTLPSEPLEYIQPLQLYHNESSDFQAAFFGTFPPAYSAGPVRVDFTAPPAEEMFLYDVSPYADSYWYVCPVTFQGYQYETISYIANRETVSPDCDDVTIQRTFPAPSFPAPS